MPEINGLEGPNWPLFALFVGYTLDPNADIYTIRPDVTDLHRLTSDRMSGLPSWTADGRILFVRETKPRQVDGPGEASSGSWTPMAATPHSSASGRIGMDTMRWAAGCWSG